MQARLISGNLVPPLFAPLCLVGLVGSVGWVGWVGSVDSVGSVNSVNLVNSVHLALQNIYISSSNALYLFIKGWPSIYKHDCTMLLSSDFPQFSEVQNVIFCTIL